jgi:predicted exporter
VGLFYGCADGREWHDRCSLLSPLFANNRRDGARLLSSALVALAICATQIQSRPGLILTLIFSALSLSWGVAYRHLER